MEMRTGPWSQERSQRRKVSGGSEGTQPGKAARIEDLLEIQQSMKKADGV